MPVRDSGPRTRLALPDERPVIAIASRGCARKGAQDAQGDIRHWQLLYRNRAQSGRPVKICTAC